MRQLARLTILGFAAYGAERLYRQVRPRLSGIAERRDSFLLAADDVADDAREVAGDAARATRDLVSGGSDAPHDLPSDAAARVLG